MPEGVPSIPLYVCQLTKSNVIHGKFKMVCHASWYLEINLCFTMQIATSNYKYKFQYFLASYTRKYLLGFGIEEGLPMDTWCPHFIETDHEVWLKKDKTRDMGILTTGWSAGLKKFNLKEETIYVFDFVVENNVVRLFITPM